MLSSPLVVKKVSFAVNRTGAPTAGLRVVLAEDGGGRVLADEPFADPEQISLWNSALIPHTLASPVSLAQGVRYKLYLTQAGQLDALNYYKVLNKSSGDSRLGFGGATCWMFSETSAGVRTSYLDRDVHFRLDSTVVEIVRLTPFLVTQSSVSIVAESNVVTNATLDYGVTTSYGSTSPRTRQSIGSTCQV